MRFLELADMPVIGAGQRPLFVAKQDAFQQIGGNGAAVERYEGLCAARTGALDGACKKLLADARLALDQDGDGGPGSALAQFARPRHGG